MSVISLFHSQVKKVDTSDYTIIRIEKVNGLSDTASLSKTQFRSYAADFLSLPDVADKDRKENYEISRSFDSLLNNLVITYTALEPEEEISRETLLWAPDSLGNSILKTIYINRVSERKDTLIEKEMTWHMDRGFQVITKTQTEKGPETVRRVQVRWH